MKENQENAVWQRVLAQPEISPDRDLHGLIRESAGLAAIYRRLAGNLTGRGKLLARALLEEELATGEILRGIAALSGHRAEGLKLWEPLTEGGSRLLEKCYHRTRHCQSDCMARSLDPEFGEVFRSLADREAEQCTRIAQLLGRLGN